MKNVHVAMIEFATGTFQGIPVGGYDVFKDAAARADALFNAVATSHSDLRILMAPEYFFAAVGKTAHGATSIGSFTSSDKLALYKKLEKTSASYSDILIVAGSIAYEKEASSGGKKHLSVCTILANGKILLKYYKKNYDQFQTGSSAQTWDTKDYGSTFKYKKVDFGIELCLDHGTSQKALKSTLGNAKVDVHLVVSAGMAPKARSVAARANGLVVNCDMSGAGGGNGITRVNSLDAMGNATLDTINNVVVRTDALAGGGHVALYSGVLG